jgi:ligand-binding sensor domain-containing protein
MEKHGWNFVAAAKSTVMAATLKTAMLSSDGGRNWTPVKLPETLEQVAAVAVDGSGGLWVGGAQGVFTSKDGGATWQTLKDLYLREVNSLFYDEPTQRILITSNSKNTIAFAYSLQDSTVHYWTTGWNLRLIRAMGDHLVGATLFDGIVVQPRMVDSSELEKPKGAMRAQKE